MNNRKLVAINLMTLATLVIVVILGIYQGGEEWEQAEAKGDIAENREEKKPEEGKLKEETNEQALEIIEKRMNVGKEAVHALDWQKLRTELDAEPDDLMENPLEASEETDPAGDDPPLGNQSAATQDRIGTSDGTVQKSPASGQAKEKNAEKKAPQTEKPKAEDTAKPSPAPQPEEGKKPANPDKQPDKPDYVPEKPKQEPSPAPAPKPDPKPEPKPGQELDPKPDPKPDPIEKEDPAEPIEEPGIENNADGRQ